MKSINNILNQFLDNPKFERTYTQTVNFVLNYPEVQEFVKQNESLISQEMIENSISKLNEFVRENELYKKGEQGQNPGFRPRLFINQNYIDVTYIPTKDFYESAHRRQKRQLLNNRMMSADVREASLQNYYLNTPQRKNLMVEVGKFIEGLKHNKMPLFGLYISGSFGVGKTYLLGALANQIVNMNKSVTMIHYPTFISEAKAGISENKVPQMIRSVQSVHVLMIDDIGAEANTVWVRDEVLTPILEHRMKENLPTFFSSNFSMEELKGHLEHTRDGGNEGMKAERVMERIRYLAKEVKLSGENLRQRQQ